MKADSYNPDRFLVLDYTVAIAVNVLRPSSGVQIVITKGKRYIKNQILGIA